MGQRDNTEENTVIYSEIVRELEKVFGHFGEMVIKNRATIKNIAQIKKMMDKDSIKFNEAMVELNMGIELFNDGIKNITNFIRSSQLGELEDIAIYLEGCVLPDFVDAVCRNSWFESNDVKAFAKNLSEENIKRMLTDITDIAFNDHNAGFLKTFTKSKLVA